MGDEENKRLAWAGGVLLVLIIGGVYLWSHFGTPPWESTLEDEYMDQCKLHLYSPEYCRCSWEALEEYYGSDGLQDMADKLDEGDEWTLRFATDAIGRKCGWGP